jgi:Protein of unknown function (DUF3703)
MSRTATRIRSSVQHELDQARRAERAGDATTAFRHLERGHVLGQALTREHVRVHLQMLRWGLRQRKPREVAGQAWRMVAAALFTALGLVPHGNTGGSDVNGLRPMPVPPDLQQLIDAARR